MFSEASMKKYFPTGIASVQKELTYEEPNGEEGKQLQDKIYEFLKRQIEITRASLDFDGRPLRTKWDRSATEQIENILFKYDEYFLQLKTSTLDIADQSVEVVRQKRLAIEIETMNKLKDIQMKIKEVFRVKEIYGFPLNFSYSTLNQIWDEVRLTDVHLIADEDSELSLSVYVNAYPAKIFSVWIFFGILKK